MNATKTVFDKISAGLLCNTMSVKAAKEAGGRGQADKKQRVNGNQLVPLVPNKHPVQCVTTPVWRQWLWPGGGRLSLQSWPAGWARFAPSSGWPRPGPAPDLESAGSAEAAAASRRRGKPKERASGHLAPKLVDFPRKASTRVMSISREGRLCNVWFELFRVCRWGVTISSCEWRLLEQVL